MCTRLIMHPGSFSAVVADPTLSQSPDIWYPDGDIVLQCQETTFRVHLDTLASYSTVFKDMATVCDLADQHPQSHAFVELQDSPSDMSKFLKAIYDPSYFQNCTSTDFFTVDAILGLSTKYLAQALRCRAIEILTSVYPCHPSALKQRLFPPLPDEFIHVLTAATKHDVRSVLPGVFYGASKRPLSDVLSELHTLPFHHAVIDDICTRFVVGRDRLHGAEIRHILRFLSPSFMRAGCTNRNSDTVKLQLQAARALPETVGSPSYQDFCSANPSLVGKQLGLCVVCCAAIESEITAGIEAIWKELPGMFGLPEWNVLTGQDRWEDQ